MNEINNNQPKILINRFFFNYYIGNFILNLKKKKKMLTILPNLFNYTINSVVGVNR